MTEVREATPADVGDIERIDAAAFGGDAWSSTAVSAEIASRDTRTVLVAHAAGAVCGYAVLFAVTEDADLHRIAVVADRRRQGVATRLLTALVERCRLDDRRALLLEVASDNGPALALYHRHGFHEIARRRRYYADGRDAVVMRRVIGPGDGPPPLA